MNKKDIKFFKTLIGATIIDFIEKDLSKREGIIIKTLKGKMILITSDINGKLETYNCRVNK